MTEWKWRKIAQHDSLTEGPAWDGDALLYNQCASSITWRYRPGEEGSTVSRTDTGGANGMCFDSNGDLYVCEGQANRVARIPANSQTSEPIADGFDGGLLNCPNDLAVTEKGRVYFSDPNYSNNPNNLPHESVYMAEKGFGGAWNIRRVTFDTSKPNGVLLSPDQKALFAADSPTSPAQRRELRVYPILDNGLLGEYTVLHDFGIGRGIDGMAMTKDGIIVATAGQEASGPGPMLYLFEQSGRVVKTVRTPVDFPTNCTFGGQNLDVLYVTFGVGSVYEVTDTGLIGHLAYPALVY